jgi:NitT/TauT family transport system permease protein
MPITSKASVTHPPEAATVPRRPGRARRPGWWGLDPLALVLPAFVLLGWWVTLRLGLATDVLFPRIEKVGESILEWAFNLSGGAYFYSGTWLRDFLGSFVRVAVGFSVGTALAMGLGVIVGWYRLAERLLDPTIQALRPIPKTAFLPFAIMLFGIGNPPALFLVIYGVFLIMYVQVVVAVKLVSRDLKRAALMLGATDRDILLRVVIPAALPTIFAGMRVAVAYAWLILILAEMLAVRGGFGYVLWHAYEFLRMDVVVAGMIAIGLFGYLTDRLVLWVMRRKLDWAQAVAATQF